MEIDGDRISFANKCLNCSVVAYCNHKTGNFNSIELPYNLSLNKVESEPKIEFNTTQNNEDDIDDLPF